jgi:hypothetical protein
MLEYDDTEYVRGICPSVALYTVVDFKPSTPFYVTLQETAGCFDFLLVHVV